MLVRSS